MFTSRIRIYLKYINNDKLFYIYEIPRKLILHLFSHNNSTTIFVLLWFLYRHSLIMIFCSNRLCDTRLRISDARTIFCCTDRKMVLISWKTAYLYCFCHRMHNGQYFRPDIDQIEAYSISTSAYLANSQ